MEQIGIAGLGRMGRAIGERLLDLGTSITVWNRTPARAAGLLERGAQLAETPRALAQSCSIILSLLTDDAALAQVYYGEQGLLSADVRGRLFIEMSTVRTSTIQALATRVATHAAALLDAPVSGTVGPARQGQLMALVGGAAADLERALPLLNQLCRRVAHVGPSGSGTTMKLVLNLPMAIYWQGLAEALALGAQAGLGLPQMLELITDSQAAIGALRIKLPVLLGEAGDAAFDISGVRKDLLAMIETGQQFGVPMPAASAALLGFMADSAAGHGADDLALHVRHYIDAVQRSTR